MQPDDREPKRGNIHQFFRSSSFKKKKVDTCTIDDSSQITQPDETACCLSNEPSKSLSLSSSSPKPSPTILSSPPLASPLVSSPLASPLASPLVSSPLASPLASPLFSPLVSSPRPCSSSLFSPRPTSSSLSSAKPSPTTLSSPPSIPSSSETLPAPAPTSALFSLLLSSSPSSPSAMAVATENSFNPPDISSSSKVPPAQPKLSSYRTNKDNRSFHSIWYSTFPWLEYSIQRDSVFCYYCRHFGDASNLLNRNQSDAFMTGYCNWKNALTKKQGFPKHETSAAHKYAILNYQQFNLRANTQTTVINVIDKSRVELIRKNRQRLTKIASAILLCSRQSISLRGHDENHLSNNRGNFIEILKWASSTDSLANSIFVDSANNATYLSPSIQNELIHQMANQIRIQIAEKLHEHVFALMADEARDSSGNEQLSVVLRFISHEPVKQNNKIDFNSVFKECFLGLVKLDEFDAQSLTMEIVQYLSSFKIDINSCIAMCFDGAAVMSGKHAGVQAILRQKYMLRAVYVHCFAHRLNLVICDVSKVVPYLSEFYSVVSKIYTYFHASSVTNECFKSIQQQLITVNNNPTLLKKWCETRWDSRWTSINALIQNYEVLIISLKELENEGDERSVDARGLLLALQVPMFIVSLFIVHKIFGIIKILSDQLKAKTIDFCKAQCLIKSVINQVTDLRNEQAFSDLYIQITSFCEEHHIDILLKGKERRIKTVSSRFKDVFITTSIGQRDNINNEDKYRTDLYYPIIDSILIELNDRFSSENMEILNGISALCPDNENFLRTEVLKAFAVQMKADLCLLFHEIQVLKSMLKDSKLKSIVDLYVELLPIKAAFPTVLSLVIAAMTIPVSSTTCERTFSKMKLIKTSARNTMSDIRLSDLCVLAVERDYDINFEKLMDNFADLHKNSRILLK